MSSKFEIKGDAILKFLEDQTKIKQEAGQNRVKIKIREHQKEAVLAAKIMLDKDNDKKNEEKSQSSEGTGNEVKPVVIVAPAGAGKTGIMALLPYILKAAMCLILTPSKITTQQSAKSFGEKVKDPSFLELVGVISSITDEKEYLEHVTVINNSEDIKNRMSNLVIVNAQRFAGKSKVSLVQEGKEIVKDVKEFFAQFDLLIVDEAHHYPAKTWTRIVEEFSAEVEGLRKKLVFLTATPYYNGSGGKLEEIIPCLKDRIAYKISPDKLEGRFIRKTEFFEIPKKYSDQTLAMDIKDRLAEQEQQEPRFKHQAMVIVNDVNAAKKYAKLLNKTEGPNFAVPLYKKGISEDKANSNIDKFSQQKFRVGVVCDLLNEGYNNPYVSLCVILRNIQSQILFSQFTGRCRRMIHFVEEELDQCTAKIISYPKFKQQQMYDQSKALAESDPTYIDKHSDSLKKGDSFGGIANAAVIAEPIPSTSKSSVDLHLAPGPAVAIKNEPMDMDEFGDYDNFSALASPIGYLITQVERNPDVQDSDYDIAEAIAAAAELEEILKSESAAEDDTVSPRCSSIPPKKRKNYY